MSCLPAAWILAGTLSLPLGTVGLAEVSKPVEDRIAALFPAYSTEARARAEAEKTRAAETPAPDSELVVLPQFTVLQKTQQRMEEETLYQRGAYDKELVKRELSEFDRYFLNRLQLGLNLGFLQIGLGGGNEARARETYLLRKRREREERIARLADVVAVTDEQEAKELRQLNRDSHWAERRSESYCQPINRR